MKDLLRKLVEAPGPSGYEAPARNVVRAELEAQGWHTWVDGLGNLIARDGENQAPERKILISAHIDEPGIIVTEVDGRGFARVAPLGKLPPRACLGRTALFLNGAKGVIGFGDPENKKEPAFDQLFVDFGYDVSEDCPVRIGDVAVLDAPFMELNGRLCGKALNNRAGAAVLIELSRRIQSGPAERAGEIAFVFSVQERIGLRGLEQAAFSLQPELALVIGSAAAGDTPQGPSSQVGLGKGPVIVVRDQHMVIDPAIIAWARETAETAAIPHQMGLVTGRSGARGVQLGREGVWTCAISLPCRYSGTGVEMVDPADIENTTALGYALLENPFRPER